MPTATEPGKPVPFTPTMASSRASRVTSHLESFVPGACWLIELETSTTSCSTEGIDSPSADQPAHDPASSSSSSSSLSGRLPPSKVVPPLVVPPLVVPPFVELEPSASVELVSLVEPLALPPVPLPLPEPVAPVVPAAVLLVDPF